MDTIPESYNYLLGKIIQITREFLEQKDSMLPHLLILGNDERQDLLPVPMIYSDYAEKLLAIKVAKVAAKVFKADFVVHVCEAWALRSEKFASIQDAVKQLEQHGSMEDTPGREEIILFTLETPVGIWMGNAALKPLPNGYRTIDDPKFTKPDGAEGLFIDLLPRSKDGNHPVH